MTRGEKYFFNLILFLAAVASATSFCWIISAKSPGLKEWLAFCVSTFTVCAVIAARPFESKMRTSFLRLWRRIDT